MMQFLPSIPQHHIVRPLLLNAPGHGLPVNQVVKARSWSFFCAAKHISFYKLRATEMHKPDLQLAQRALEGDAEAVAGIEARRAMLERVLISCGARSRSEAEEIVADILADCFGARERSRGVGSNRILEQYRGQCSLDSWLITVSRNRWRDLVASAGETRIERGTDRDAAVYDERQHEPDITAILGDALNYGMSKVEPLALIFLRLVYLHGISQREVAAAWRCHESKVSRLLKDGFATMKDESIEFLKKRDPHLHLEWRDLMGLCDTAAELLHGG